MDKEPRGRKLSLTPGKGKVHPESGNTLEGRSNKLIRKSNANHQLHESDSFEEPYSPPTAEELEDWYAIEPIALPKIIEFLCRHIMIYETVICIMLCLNFSLFPFDWLFNVYDPLVANMMYAFDVLFAIDVILRLIVHEWCYHTQAQVTVFTCK